MPSILDLADDLADARQENAKLQAALRRIAVCDCGHAETARAALGVELISYEQLCALLPDAHVERKNDGELVIYTGLALGTFDDDSAPLVKWGTETLTISSPSAGMREALAMSDEEVRAATLPPYTEPTS